MNSHKNARLTADRGPCTLMSMERDAKARRRAGCVVGGTAAAFLAAFAMVQAAVAEPFVAVTAIVEHATLDAVRDGVRDRLAEAGLRTGRGLRFEYRSAGADAVVAAAIARDLASARPDVIVAISIPSAAAIAAATADIPVVFAAVEDPLVAGLVTDAHANVTGLAHRAPLTEHLSLILELLPQATKVGVPFGSNTPRIAAEARELATAAAAFGIEVVAVPVASRDEFDRALETMITEVDAVLLLGGDELAAAGLEHAAELGAARDVPIFATDPEMVAGGAVAALYLDYYDLGRQAGDLVLRILAGEAPAHIPVRPASATGLVVNPEAAESMGLRLPPRVIDRARSLVE